MSILLFFKKNKEFQSIIWSAIERFSVQILRFILTIILARLVTPNEYGLIAMLTIFLQLGQTFVDSGFSSALIQKSNRNEVDFATCFYFNFLFSCLIYLILYIFSPYIGLFYNEPILSIIIKYSGINLILSSLSLVQRTKLTIDLNFKKQTKITLIATILSGLIGIILAYLKYGVWALVAESLLNNLFICILLWISSKWKPLFTFSVNSFKHLFNFGGKLLGAAILNTLYINMYSLVIGKFYTATDVGYYNRAYSFSQFTSYNITGIITRATYPIQCKLQDDPEQLQASLIKHLRISGFIVFPATLLLAAISKPFISFILTDKWLEVANLLPILCISYLWFPLCTMNNLILYVKNRTDYALKSEIVKKCIAVSILIFTLPFGIKILCWGFLLYNLSDYLITLFFVKKVLNIKIIGQIKIIIPILISAFIPYIIVSIFSNYNSLPDALNLILSICLYIIIYTIIIIIIKPEEFKFINKKI